MSSTNERILRGAKAAMLKAHIDEAREDRMTLRELGQDRAAQKRWTQLIRQWKRELKELTGEEY